MSVSSEKKFASLRQHRLPEAVAFAQTAAYQAPDSAEINAIFGQCLLTSDAPQAQCSTNKVRSFLIQPNQ
jgi:hypothetical protein